ncbi:MAG: (S)-ureidoglycine aminohydrolase [Meiothermus sp.]|uniref:(S)-ureidoglycine aminohydrolase n=1 Tax=Meiothermus sp. TaxID=1955249 RepID=UPI0025F26CFA|nr:(S)-ureidoglycine aminohydrolase [Meiothermus sp.]MCS7059256.1 (S)-ureidoglycine aminohydrolase [Meiothermus sp.]MCS7193851.1 (S)-ureidoglycine aminohydrolase [Meiothermus sp.]MCX7739550.1 (S)-ureidoglycine aminohydrolase [Meiothermus sp.]MDW8090311.1 (S)-ureidoglycine aminohydrolase [Meiothermus sp.]MDW8481272.1 (S)-ureidoglycine aminohydrolase [Meiothermus sp.]
MSLTGFTRTHVAPDHALLTPDTFIRAPLPGWTNTLCIVHISPELGARFKMYTAEMQPGGSGEMTLLDIQRFAYVLSGRVGLEVAGAQHTLEPHRYAYLPANTPHRFTAYTESRMVVFEKPYQALAGAEAPSLVLGFEPEVAATPLMGDEALQVRLLLPDHPSFDLAVNTMTFEPGAHLPMVETHVMEHGLLFLQGGGVYRLGERWYPVQTGDVIWMASYCPQWFGALGKGPSKYLIYKDVNRHSLELL